MVSWKSVHNFNRGLDTAEKIIIASEYILEDQKKILRMKLRETKQRKKQKRGKEI